MIKCVSAALGIMWALAIAGGQARAANVAKGKQIVRSRCTVYHTLEKGKSEVGRSLFGVVGRKAGTAPNCRYSKSYHEAAKKGLVWSQNEIVTYLNDPKAFMIKASGDPRAQTRMFFHLTPKDERRDVAAYLATLK